MDDDWFEDSEPLYPDGMDGPRVRTPSVDIPEPSEDVFQSSPIARLFVLHVLVWNAVILLVSLGVMLIYFRNDWHTGQRLLVAGVALTVYGIYRWPRGDGEGEGDDEDADDEADATSEGSKSVTDAAEATVDPSEVSDAPDAVTDGDARDAKPDS